MTTIQFTTLYKEHYDALMNFATKLTRDQTDAEDLVQETAMKAYKGLHTFKIGSSFKSWSFTILKNTFINKYHKRKKRAIVNKPIEDFTHALECKYNLKNDAISYLSAQDLEKKIGALTETCKEPFLMHTRGYQYSEISDILDIPLGTVKSRINYARTKLKQVLSSSKAA